MNAILRDSDGLCGFTTLSGLIIVIGLTLILFAGLFYAHELNDEAYYKTLDKLNCEQIWILMQTGTDWDTMDYYGDRCN